MKLRAAVIVTSILLLAFAAEANAENPAVAGNTTARTVDQLAHTMSPQESELLNTVCLNVMKLLRAGPEFAGCVSSLSWSLSDQENQNLIQAANGECSNFGLKPTAPDFAGCVLNRQRILSAADRETQDGAQTARNSISFVNDKVGLSDVSWLGHAHVSYGLRAQREQNACAALGLSPHAGLFASCVSDLELTMFNIDHPPG